MRLSLSINSVQCAVAAVSGPGYLGAHLNLRDRPKDDDHSKDVRLSGSQTLETETIHLEWPTFHLETGDTVELRVLSDGDGDTPIQVRRSYESPKNLFSSRELASQVLALVSDFDSRLIQILNLSKESEPEEDHKKFLTATGHVVSEIGERLLYPIYRRHRDLIPDEFKGELL